MNGPETNEVLLAEVRRWRRRAVVGWAVLLLALACAGIHERVERLEASTVVVTAPGQTITLRGGQIVLADGTGRRTVVSVDGVRSFAADGTPRP